MRCLTLWPEWCPAFPGVRLRDGTASVLDKPCENRPMAPWAIIAPRQDPRAGFSAGPLPFLPGPWIAMHAGKHIGGKAGNDGALGDVVFTARDAGWALTVEGDRVRLTKGSRSIAIGPDDIVTSAIVALFRITRVAAPGVGGPWRFTDRFGWYVEMAPLDVPVPCKGAQGLWAAPDDVRDAVLTHVPASIADQVRDQRARGVA